MDETWFLLLEGGVRDQDLGIMRAQCPWQVLPSTPSQQTEQGDTCVCILTCGYKCLYMVLLVSMLS